MFSGLAAVQLLSLTLPPSPGWLNRALLITSLVGVGLALAWLPLSWAGLFLAAVIFGTLLLLKPIWAVYALIPLIPFSSLLAVSFGAFKVGLMEIVLALGLVAWLLQLSVRHHLPKTDFSAAVSGQPSAVPLLWPFLLLLTGVMLSWLDAFSIGASLVETAKWVEMLALYLFIVALLPSRRLGWIVLVILLAGVAQAVLGLYQFVFKVGPAGFLLFDGRFLRAYGTFAQPNPYAGYLGLVLPLALALFIWRLEITLACLRQDWFNRQSLISNLPLGIALALMLAALFASQSRSAWLAFACAAVITIAAWNRKGAMLVVTLVFIAAVIGLTGLLGQGLLSANSVLARFGDAFAITTINDVTAIEVTDANFATIERLAHWQAAREMWRDHPWLGVGFGNYAAIYPAYAVGRWLDPLGHAHNYLLNIGAETGLVGISAYLIFWIWVFRVLWVVLRRSHGFERAVAAGGLGILVHLHIHNLFDNLYVQGMYLHVAIIIALISIIYHNQCQPTQESY